jgi:hypothetical protein
MSSSSKIIVLPNLRVTDINPNKQQYVSVSHYVAEKDAFSDLHKNTMIKTSEEKNGKNRGISPPHTTTTTTATADIYPYYTLEVEIPRGHIHIKPNHAISVSIFNRHGIEESNDYDYILTGSIIQQHILTTFPSSKKMNKTVVTETDKTLLPSVQDHQLNKEQDLSIMLIASHGGLLLKVTIKLDKQNGDDMMKTFIQGALISTTIKVKV